MQSEITKQAKSVANHLISLSKLTVCFAFCSLLIACNFNKPSFWVNNSNPSANFEIDKANCANEAEKSVSAVYTPPVTYTPPGAANTITCNQLYAGSVNCISSPNAELQNANAFNQFNAMINGGGYSRNILGYVKNCLISRGWTETSAPSAVKGQSGVPSFDIARLYTNIGNYKIKMQTLHDKWGREICRAKEFSSYFSKTACNPVSITNAQQSRTDKVTSAEIDAIKSLSKVQATYVQEQMDEIDQQIKTLHPNVVSNPDTQFIHSKIFRDIVLTNFDQEKYAMLQLIRGELNWGEYNRRLSEINNDTNLKFKTRMPTLFDELGSVDSF